MDAFDPSVLVSTCATKIFDFLTCSEASLQDISIPLQLQVTAPGACAVHGVATWFDVLFNGSSNCVWLSTAPGLPTTHWFQLRCLLKTPIHVQGPCMLSGHLRLVAHARQSYNVQLELQGPPLGPGQPPQMVRSPPVLATSFPCLPALALASVSHFDPPAISFSILPSCVCCALAVIRKLRLEGAVLPPADRGGVAAHRRQRGRGPAVSSPAALNPF